MNWFRGTISFVKSLFQRTSKMDQYSEMLVSAEYAAFIKENAAYAREMGYNVETKKGLTEAMSDQFLFNEFLLEETV